MIICELVILDIPSFIPNHQKSDGAKIRWFVRKAIKTLIPINPSDKEAFV